MLVRAVVMVAVVCGGAARAHAGLPPELELGARFGMHSTVMDFSDDAPQGKGPLVDTSAGYRPAPWFSASVFFAFSSFHDSFEDPFDIHRDYDASVRLYDVGIRLSLHGYGVVGGLGFGREYATTHGDANNVDHCSLLELHLGYTFPRIPQIGGGAIQLLAFVGKANTEYERDVIFNARLALGIEY